MKHKILGIMVMFLVFSMGLSNFALADSLGNEQYYTVYFDEEGDAVVMAKLTFHNAGDDNLDFVMLEVPERITILNALQEVEEEIEDEDYWRGYRTETRYYTIDPSTEVLSDSTLLTVEFPDTVGEQETATILLYYKVPALAKENMGLYNFDFTTIKTDYDTYYVRVSVNAVNGLVMDGVEGEVDYLEWDTVTAESTEEDMEYVTSSTLDSASRSIEYYRGVTEEAYALDPQESFTISGEFATSSFRLHVGRNIILGLIGLGLVVGIGIAFQRLFSGIGKKKKYTEMILAGSLVGITLVLILGGGIYVIENLRQWVGYEFDELFAFLIGVSMFLVSLAGMVLPGVALGKKHKDLLVGLGTAGITVATLMIAVFVLVGLFVVI